MAAHTPTAGMNLALVVPHHQPGTNSGELIVHRERSPCVLPAILEATIQCDGTTGLHALASKVQSWGQAGVNVYFGSCQTTDKVSGAELETVVGEARGLEQRCALECCFCWHAGQAAWML